MHAPGPSHPAISPGRRLTLIVLKALRSTLVICAVALLVTALRSGGLSQQRLKTIAHQDWYFVILIFLFVLAWDILFKKSAR